MKEIWKDIKGYEGLYKISSLGKIMALSRTVRFGNQYRKTETKLMKPRRKGKYNSYLTIILYDKNHRAKTYNLHRIVAKHFVDGYFDGAEVNHKDGNKANNVYKNLEWVTRSYNIKHSYYTLGQKRMKGKVVLQLTLDNEPVCFYQSAVEASNVTGISKSSITDCAIGKQSHAGQFLWKYF